MDEVKKEYKKLFSKKSYKISLLIGILILILSAIFSSLAISYADERAGSSLNDLILDNIPTINLFLFRALFPFAVLVVVLIFALRNPSRLPILAKAVGLMYIVRAFFISLTNIKLPLDKVPLSEKYSLFSGTYGGNDLFFSGHVAFPFIAALVFWDKKGIRNFLLILTFISGIAALVSKSHYSIDVFAAPLISYSVYKITEKVFSRDFGFYKNKPK